MENVNVVENMMDPSSKTKVGLKVIYSFAAQSFPQLVAEPVRLLGLPGQYRAVNLLTNDYSRDFITKQ